MGRAAGCLFSLLVVAVLGVAAAILWFDSEVSAPGPLAEPATVIVPRGTSLAMIATELERQNVISDSDLMIWRARWRDEETSSKPASICSSLAS